MLTKKELVDQLSILVAFRTLTGDVESNRRALDYVQSLLSPKAKMKRVRNGPAEILLAGNTDSLNPDFGYLVHIDVVAASEKLFTLRREGDRVFGRGVSDMKFSIPLGIALLNEAVETNSQVTFSLAITTDEETGGFGGGKFLATELAWQPKALIVPDGGDNLNFVSKGKGVAQFQVSAKGVSAHASRPWLGKNALPPLCQLVVELEQRYGQNSQQANWNTTLNFGQLIGGVSTNQVCDSAVLKLDFRYPETDSFERIEQELLALAESIDPEISIARLSTGLPTVTDVKLTVVQRFLQTLQDEFQQEIPVKPNYGASDARHFAPFKIPVLMIKPVGGDIHCETEWLDIASTQKFYQALRKFIFPRKEI